LNWKKLNQLIFHLNLTSVYHDRINEVTDKEHGLRIAVLRLLQSKTSILDEHRGLLATDKKNVAIVTLPNLGRKLLKLLNSGERVRQRFNDIQDAFGRMVKRHGFTFDVRENYQQGEAMFSFQQNGHDMTIEDAPGGIVEALMIASVMFIGESETVIMDEPGRTMHPQMLTGFMDVLKSCQKSVIFTTHLPHLITRDLFPNVMRCKRLDLSRDSTHITRLSQLSLDENVKKILTGPHIARVFFAHGVIWVEGDNDFAFFQALRMSGEEGRRNGRLFHFDIIKLDGKDTIQHCLRICEVMKVPYIFVCDLDI
jgi:hypothetical protein